MHATYRHAMWQPKWTSCRLDPSPLGRPAPSMVWHGAQVGKGKVVKVSGIREQGRTATVLLRGSNKLVLEEAERSLHDALCALPSWVAL